MTQGRGVPDDPSAGLLAAESLRLRAGADVAEIAGLALDALVPGLTDAAAVFTAERLLRGSGPLGHDGQGGPGSPGTVTVRRAGIRFARGDESHTAFPAEKAVVLAPDSPYARCLSEGKPIAFTVPDRQTLENAGTYGRALFSRYESFLAVPMSARGIGVGLIALARGPGRRVFGDSDIGEIARLAVHAGTSIATVVNLARYQSVAGAMQRGLLAAEPGRPEHLDVAGQCVPAGGHLVGGDWYDIIPLPGARTGIVIGDVMGHGPEAAALMAQFRAAAHVLAELDLEPGDLLRRLDLLAATLPGMPLVTCMYTVFDPGAQCCTLTAAGHLPPVLARPDGTTRTLDIPGGQSLGIGPANYGQARFKLPPGAVVALYTDGLVETRTRSFDQGISVLRAELSRARGPLEATCETLIRTLACHPEDDVTLILARIPPP